MQVTVDLIQLLLALLILVGVALGIFLIILFARLIGTFKRVSKLLDGINDPVTSTVEQLPDLIRKVDVISKDVTVLTESINQTVPAMLKDAQTITGTAREGVEAIGGAAKSVGEGFSSFFKPAAPAHTDYLSSLIDIVSQVFGVVSFFIGRKKSNARAKAKSRGRQRR